MFSQEKELVDAFTSKSEELLKTLSKKAVSRSFLIHEFNSYFGVADVVLGTLKPSLARTKRRESVNPNWIMPLASLRRGDRVTVDGFSTGYGLSKTTARRYLNDYQQAGFLLKADAGNFRVIKEYTAATDLVISIEAKLRDWRRALGQAQRYKRFSDLSFVLLDGEQSASAIKNIALFHEKNIGLLCLTNAKLDILYVPEKNSKKMQEFYLRIAEMAYDSYKARLQSC